MATAPDQTRLPTLDGWRAVAIAAVLACHIRWPVLWMARISDYGGLGVQLFFALSGFLITSRLLEENDRNGCFSWAEFYIRRAFRILPAAFFALGILAVLGLALHAIPVAAITPCLLFYRNYVSGGGWYTGHFWSLSVEEHFYLLWPALLALFGVARGARTAATLAAAAIVWRIADRHFDWVGHMAPLLRGNEHRTDYCIAQLLWGCVLAFAWHSEAFRKVLHRYVRSYWVVPIFAAQTLLLRYEPKWYDAPFEILMALLPLVTIADPRGIVSRILETGLLVWLGRLSYSLYLWQQLFLPMRFAPWTLGIVQQLPWNILCATAAAAFSYYCVEQPFIRAGKKLIAERRNRRQRYPSALTAAGV